MDTTGRTGWDTLAHLFDSPIALATLVFIFLTIVALILSGRLNLKIKGVETTVPDAIYKEHVILRRQIQWLVSYITGQEGLIHKCIADNPEGVIDEYKNEPEFFVRYCLLAMTDYIIINWIVLNHLKKSDIKARSEELLQYLGSLTKNIQYERKVFGGLLEIWTETVITNLVRIRGEY